MLVVAGLAGMAGCGLKGPPLPPIQEGYILAPPQNLAYTLDKDTATLTWTHTVDPVNARISPEGFRISVAVKGADHCEGCPFTFNPAGTVAMPVMQFRYTLKQGYHYYFRVQALGSKDTVSTPSDTLYIAPQE